VVGVLETYEYDETGVVGNRLDVCPFCDHGFADHEARWRHYLDDHDPEDAGLSALGSIPEDADAPLFRSVDELPGGEAGGD
jgi:hypothetical protein